MHACLQQLSVRAPLGIPLDAGDLGMKNQIVWFKLIPQGSVSTTASYIGGPTDSQGLKSNARQFKWDLGRKANRQCTHHISREGRFTASEAHAFCSTLSVLSCSTLGGPP